jgi:hypothetical protein
VKLLSLSLSFISAISVLIVSQQSAQAESLIDCNQMTRRTKSLFVSELKKVGVVPIQGVQAQQRAISASIGVQQRNEFKATHQKIQIVNGEKMYLEYIDDVDKGFFRKNDRVGGWNDQFISTQIWYIVRRLKNNSIRTGKSTIYFGIDFTSNGSREDDRRQCTGTVIYSVP